MGSAAGRLVAASSARSMVPRSPLLGSFKNWCPAPDSGLVKYHLEIEFVGGCN